MEYFEAGLKLGLPIMMMSWWVHSWLFRNGLLDPHASQRETEQEVRKIRKSTKKSEVQYGDFWTKKWLKFGGGFYGLTALWTFLVLEIQGLWWLLTNYQSALDILSNGFVYVVVTFIKNQVMSFVQAFSWVVNWGDSGFSLIWFFSAYLGFYLGMKAAVWKH